jgi:hypothetical protein
MYKNSANIDIFSILNTPYVLTKFSYKFLGGSFDRFCNFRKTSNTLRINTRSNIFNRITDYKIKEEVNLI